MKIFLRGLVYSDREIIYEWKKDEGLRDSVGTIFPISESEHVSWFENIKNGNDRFFVICLEDGVPLGLIGLHDIDYVNGNTMLSILIGEEKVRNSGIGTAALKEIMKFIFETMRLNVLYLKVFSYNLKAIRFYEKNGFIQTGYLQENVYKFGEFHDAYLFSMTKNQYEVLF